MKLRRKVVYIRIDSADRCLKQAGILLRGMIENGKDLFTLVVTGFDDKTNPAQAFEENPVVKDFCEVVEPGAKADAVKEKILLVPGELGMSYEGDSLKFLKQKKTHRELKQLSESLGPDLTVVLFDADEPVIRDLGEVRSRGGLVVLPSPGGADVSEGLSSVFKTGQVDFVTTPEDMNRTILSHLQPDAVFPSAPEMLRERVKEQECLYEISRLPAITLDTATLLKQAAKIIPQGFQVPESTSAEILYRGKSYQSPDFQKSDYALTSTAEIYKRVDLKIYVYAAGENNGGTPAYQFFEEEQTLTDHIADILAIKVDYIRFRKNLKRKEADLEKILNTSLDIICKIDENGIFRLLSSAVKNIWGYEPEELVGKSYEEIIAPEDIGKTRKMAEKAFSGQHGSNFVNQYIHKDGRKVAMMWSARWNEKDRMLYCVARDYTENIRVENKLRDGEAKLRMAQNIARLGYWEFNPKTKKIVWSDQLYRIFGLDPEKDTADYQTFVSRIHPDDMDAFNEAQRASVEEGIPKDLIHRIRLSDGTEKYVHQLGSTIFDEDGKPALLQGTVQDVTELKAAEHKLSDERNLLRAIIDNLPEEIYVKDREHKIRLCNKQVYQNLIGADSEEEVIGNEVYEYLDYETARLINEEEKEILNEGKSIRDRLLKIKTKSGEEVWQESTKEPLAARDGTITGLVGISRNVTESYYQNYEEKIILNVIRSLHAQKSIRESLRSTLEILCLELDFDIGEAWLVNRNKSALNAAAFWGRDEKANALSQSGIDFKLGEGLPGTIWNEAGIIWWGDILKHPKAARKALLEKAGIQSGLGVPVKIKDEVIVVITLYKRESIKPNKYLYRILERFSLQIGIDVRRKQILDELDNFFNNSPELLGVATPDGRFVKVNPKFSDLLGYKEDEILNRPFIDFVHPDDVQSTVDQFKMNREGEITSSFVNRYRTKSGDYKWINWHSSEWVDFEDVIYAYGSDITDLKNANLELEKYRQVIESTKDGVGMINLKTGDLYLNQAMVEMFGYSEKDIMDLGGPVGIYKDKNVALNMFETIENGGFWKGDVEIKHKAGRVIDVYLNAGHVKNEYDEIVAVYGIHTDISERKRYEKELEEINHKITNILQSIRDGFIVLDYDWKVTYWNREAEQQLKVGRDDILGKNIWDFFPTARQMVFYEKYKQVMETREPVRFEAHFPDLESWFDISSYPTEEGISIFFRNITREKEIALERERLLSVIENSLNEIYVINPDTYTFDYVNEGALRNLGYSREEIIGKTPVDIVVDYNHEKLRAYMERLNEQEGAKLVTEGEHRRKDGTVYPIELHMQKAEFEHRHYFLAIVIDTTERKQTARELIALNQELKKRMDELAVSNQELEQFAYIASHDLQEPLRMVTSFLAQIERKYSDKLDEKGLQYIHFAVDGAARMRRIILDLLEYSRVGRREYKVTDVDLNQVIEEILQMNQNTIEERRAVIKYDNLPVIRAPKTQIQQVLQNLINNAIKYQHEQSGPIVEITAHEIRTHWHIMVKDNGIGIDARFHDKIFVIFQRLHKKEDYSGTGIGLAICKKIVENLNGEIWVESEEGEGSTFHFTIQKPNTGNQK